MSRRMSSRRAEFPTALLEMAQNRTALLRMHSPSKPIMVGVNFVGSFLRLSAEVFIEHVSRRKFLASDSRCLWFYNLQVFG